MRQLFIRHQPGRTEAALVEEGLLTDYHVYPERGLQVEQIYLGKVDRIAKAMNAAFVTLPEGQNGFLPYSEAKEPLKGGMSVLVQVKKPPVQSKAAYLTQDISIAGRLTLLLPRSSFTGVSSRVQDPETQARMRAQ
ncbi:MAG: hypothetical protein IJ240_07380, partial [Clostridia bacterium]|nr:hypothetical protein [Clostridia bacterium]